jgi:hypothetical protein
LGTAAVWVRDGPQPKSDSEPRTEDEEKALKAKAQLARQKMLTEGSRVRLVSLSRQKAELAGKRKMETRWSEEIFVVDKVLKRGADTLNVAYEYKLRRTNGQPKTGKYKREQLQLIPKLTIEWHGRAIKGKWAELAQLGVVPKKGVRDGSSQAERVIDEIPAAQRGGLGYEQLLGRLVQYLRSGMELDDATARLRETHNSAPGQIHTTSNMTYPGTMTLPGYDLRPRRREGVFRRYLTPLLHVRGPHYTNVY